MLAKLIKYNFKHTYKSILIFIIALFASVLLFNLTAYEFEYVYEMQDGQRVLTDIIGPSELQQFFHGFANFMISCSLILLFASAIRSFWRYFKSNFYGDESYLTHTLPISRRTLWAGQFCNILLTFVIIIIAIILNCLLLTFTHNGMQLLESFGLIGGCSHCVGEYYSAEPLSLGFYLVFILIILTEFIFLTLCGIFGIIISHRVNKKISILAGLSVYLIGGIIILAAIAFIGRFDQSTLSIFSNNPTIATPGYSVDHNGILHTLFYISLFYAGYSTTLYLVNQKLLSRGINVD